LCKPKAHQQLFLQIWDVISPTRAYEIVNAEIDPTTGAKKLVKAAVSSAKCNDNVSSIVVRL